MKDFARFIPSIFAATAILGCLLPFSGNPGQQANLLSLPDAFAQAGNMIGMFGSGARTHGAPAAADPTLAVWTARLVFLAPLFALWIIVQNLRGKIGETLQLVSAGLWILTPILIPFLAGKVLLASVPFLANMAKAFGGETSFFSLNFGIGGWLLLLSGVGMALFSFGVLRFIPETPTAR